ncbi:UNVERIFIED_CONTAM: hypothetical protein Sindi_0937700 [Sesamum indicum]
MSSPMNGDGELPNSSLGDHLILKFKTVIDIEEVIERGPWMFQGQLIVLQKWESSMAMRKLKHTLMPVWIKLRHLPMEFWTMEGLSTIVSGVGTPLYPDAITRACTRLDFARVCVMLDVTQKLPKYIIIMTPDEDGGETPGKVDVEYEWLPLKCTGCMTLGHTTKDCSLNKSNKHTKPPVAVYVPKEALPDSHRPLFGKRVEDHKVRIVRLLRYRDPRRAMSLLNAMSTIITIGVRQWSPIMPLMLYVYLRTQMSLLGVLIHATPLVVIHVECRCIECRGLDKQDHQLALKDLVSEYMLHFVGILETRVRINNVMHIQSFLLPQWKWFVDYASIGNHICLAWDNNFIDVHVLDLREQFMHCRVTTRAVNESIMFTIIYGASEVVDRRALWNRGWWGQISMQSEILMRMDMEEFSAGIQEAGLMPLPMQGEWYTWHNRSSSPWSLWERLDRLLINDRCLAPRISDHSLLSYMGIYSGNSEVVGLPMFAITRKLKALKPVFRQQRRNKGI